MFPGEQSPERALRVTNMTGWLYVAACVLLPGAWGVFMYWAFSAFDRRRKQAARRDARPPVDYSI